MVPSVRDGFDAVVLLALLAAATASGALLLGRLSRGEEERYETDSGLRLAESAAAGLVLLHVLLLLLDLIGVPWHPLLLGSLSIAAAGSWWWRRAHRSRVGVWSWGWADAVAILSVTAFGTAAWKLRSPFTDFVYHWGLKAHRFTLARGIDWEFLAAPARPGYLHPDYPHLLPDLTAASAILSGRFFEPALLLVTPVFLALLLLVARAEIRSSIHPHALAEVWYAGLALGIGAFCIGYYQAGSADPPLAFALLLGASALREDSPRGAAIRGGLAAGLAASLKIEGVPLAGILVALVGLRHGRTFARRLPLVAFLVGPAALAVLPWAFQVARHDLLQPTNSAGVFAWDLHRLRAIAGSAWEVLLVPEWHGLSLLVLLLPVLLIAPASRWIAVLCLVQLGLYFWVYLTSPLEPRFLVLSNLPRLLLHVVPATWLALAIAVATVRGDPLVGGARHPTDRPGGRAGSR